MKLLLWQTLAIHLVVGTKTKPQGPQDPAKKLDILKLGIDIMPSISKISSNGYLLVEHIEKRGLVVLHCP